MNYKQYRWKYLLSDCLRVEKFYHFDILDNDVFSEFVFSASERVMEIKDYSSRDVRGFVKKYLIELYRPEYFGIVIRQGDCQYGNTVSQLKVILLDTIKDRHPSLKKQANTVGKYEQ